MQERGTIFFFSLLRNHFAFLIHLHVLPLRISGARRVEDKSTHELVTRKYLMKISAFPPFTSLCIELFKQFLYLCEKWHWRCSFLVNSHHHTHLWAFDARYPSPLQNLLSWDKVLPVRTMLHFICSLYSVMIDRLPQAYTYFSVTAGRRRLWFMDAQITLYLPPQQSTEKVHDAAPPSETK